MNTGDILKSIRTKNGLTQDDMAQKFCVTRQAVSRWESGETTPNTETLKQLSAAFNVSINTLLGSPQKLYCQCCGMPLDDASMSREPDRSFNEEYCKWCYADGKFTYQNMDDLISFLINHMSSEDFPKDQAEQYFKEAVPKLRHWKDQKNS